MNNTQLNNIPAMTQELKEKSIIELAKEAVKGFPEKLNATHKEIIELVEDWENYDQWETENKAHNEKLLEKYNEKIEPLIEKVKEAQAILSNADNKINEIIDELYKDKIAQAWKRTKEGDGWSKEYLEEHPTPDKNSTFYREIALVEKLKDSSINNRLEKLRTLLKDGYYKRYSDETWRKTTYYGDDKRDAEKKLKTRLAKLGVINK